MKALLFAIVVVSDLHLDSEFPWSKEFVALVESLEPGTTLVLNGDTFGSDSVAALEARASVVASLARFGALDGNRLVLVPGDTDHALATPERQALVRERLNGEVAAGGSFRSEDGKILIEHGHSRDTGPDVSFYDDSRETYPILDHFAERAMGVKYALSLEPEQATPELLRSSLLNMSWQQFRRDLEQEVAPPAWDLPAVRQQGAAFVRESLPKDDPLYSLWDNVEIELDTVTDDELLALCDYRAAVRRARRRMERGITQFARIGPVVAECPRTPATVGPSFSYFWSARDKLYAKFDDDVSIVVHAHTHLADRGFRPSPDGEGPLIVNSGTFRRTLTPARFEALKEERRASTEELLPTLAPADLPPCHAFVRIDANDDNEPEPEVLYWTSAEDGTFTAERRCR